MGTTGIWTGFQYCRFRQMGCDTVSFESVLAAMPAAAPGAACEGVIRCQDFAKYPWEEICDSIFRVWPDVCAWKQHAGA